jgi:mannose-6-phosphate isomerase-like protein (cupin superfamily)
MSERVRLAPMRFPALVVTLVLSASALLAQDQPSATVVSSAQVESTMKHSVENNILDTKMTERLVKGGLVRVGIVHRKNTEAKPLMHEQLTEIYQILEGSGTITTGGAMPDPKPVSDPPNLGPTPSFQGDAVGGTSRKVGPKDILIVPAGMPHRFTQLDGPISYVIYRFEPVPPVK